MKIAILHNSIPAKVIVRDVAEKDANAIREGDIEAEDVSAGVCEALGVPCEEWFIAEDSEFLLDVKGAAGSVVEKRLEELRKELQAERISYGELAELQKLAPYIESGDVELLEAAGVPEK